MVDGHMDALEYFNGAYPLSFNYDILRIFQLSSIHMYRNIYSSIRQFMYNYSTYWTI
jgi:hypothetical protein